MASIIDLVTGVSLKNQHGKIQVPSKPNSIFFYLALQKILLVIIRVHYDMIYLWKKALISFCLKQNFGLQLRLPDHQEACKTQ